MMQFACQTAADGAGKPIAIDLARLEEITGGNPIFAKELIELFFGDTEQALGTMRLLLQTDDRVLLRREAHRVKGGCGHMGALGMLRIAGELERMAPVAEFADLSLSLGALDAEFKRVREELIRHRATTA